MISAVIGFGNRLEVDVATEVMFEPQLARDRDNLLHGVVRAADDAGRQEQPLDIVAAIEVERQLHHFIDGEARALHVGRGAVDAIQAIEVAGIGQQDLEQRDTAAIRRIGVADARAFGRADAFAVSGVALLGAAGGAGGVIFGGISQDLQLALHVHLSIPLNSTDKKSRSPKPGPLLHRDRGTSLIDSAHRPAFNRTYRERMRGPVCTKPLVPLSFLCSGPVAVRAIVI